MSTGDWALAAWNGDRFAGVVFWGGDRGWVRWGEGRSAIALRVRCFWGGDHGWVRWGGGAICDRVPDVVFLGSDRDWSA